MLLRFLLLIISFASIAENSIHEQGTFKVFQQNSNDSVKIALGYSVYIPPSYNALNEWPLIVFLHGSGVRGNDPKVPQRKGVGTAIHDGQHIPSIVLIPQSPKEHTWNDLEIMKAVLICIEEVKSNYRVDTNRIYLTGNSLGGMGTWAIGAYAPNIFAAISPLSGYGDVKNAEKLKSMPIWGFHGAKDDVFSVAKGQEMFDAVKLYNPNVKFTVYPEAGHRPWKFIYKDPDFYTWLLKQSK